MSIAQAVPLDDAFEPTAGGRGVAGRLDAV